MCIITIEHLIQNPKISMALYASGVISGRRRDGGRSGLTFGVGDGPPHFISPYGH